MLEKCIIAAVSQEGACQMDNSKYPKKRRKKEEGV
jgi:hypothetical protein